LPPLGNVTSVSTPQTFILHRSAVDPALLHLGEESTDVVAHEKERVAGAL
jgi:hypothetical protein